MTREINNKIKVVLFRSTGVLIAVISLFSSPVYGQKDTVKNFKNTIRFNLSNPLLFDWKFNIIGYERVINNRQTASISIGSCPNHFLGVIIGCNNVPPGYTQQSKNLVARWILVLGWQRTPNPVSVAITHCPQIHAPTIKPKESLA